MTIDKTITSKVVLNRFETLEKELLEIHAGKYSYRLSEYSGMRNKIDIECKHHGVFSQTPASHKTGVGCPKCGQEKTADAVRGTTEDFIKKAVGVYGDKYLYSHTEYKDYYTPVTITCKEHGEFYQTPDLHMKGFEGCKVCTKWNKSEALTMSQKVFIDKAETVHSGKYIYTDTKYLGTRELVEISCPTHGKFLQNAGSHLRGKGCRLCANGGFDFKSPATLYYLSINHGEVFKIGITNRSVSERFLVKELRNIEVLETTEFLLGEDCYKEEQRILLKYKEYQYVGPKLLVSGNTELFHTDIRKI